MPASTRLVPEPLSLLACALALLAFTACKEEPPDPETYYIDKEYYPYIIFKPGSYWVYEDSVSGAVDSVEVTGFEQYTEPMSIGKDSYCFLETMIVNWHSHFFGKDGFYVASISCIPPYSGGSCFFTQKGINESGGETSPVYVSKFHPKIGYVSSTGAYMTNIFTDYAVDSLTFQNVSKLYVPEDYTSEGNPSYYYFGKDAGIIRWEDKSPSGTWRVWKLKRYHAVR